jgi:hypothetical protein
MTRPKRTNRSRQKTATRALAKLPSSRVITMAEINEMRRRTTSTVRLGRTPRLGGEYGASGTLNVMGTIYNEDYNSLFDGKNGIAIFDQMFKSDGTVGATTDVITAPIRGATLRAEYPDEPSAKEKEIVDTLNRVLFENGEWPDGESWDFYLRHLLLRIPYGVGLCEQVWTFDDDEGVLKWKRLAPRLPKSIDRFMVNPDGSLKEVIQYVSLPGSGIHEYRVIDPEYLCISVRDREGDNYWGKSIYRRLYKHWFYKDDAYRIDGIRLDRFGVGVPVAKIEQGHVLEEDELNEIELTLIALRSHERAYIIEPPLVSFRIMVPEGGHGGVTGLMESVKHHDMQIVRGVLATFLGDQAEGLNTNRTKTLADFFLHALRSEAVAISGDIRSQMVRRWCNVNFDMSDARVPPLKWSGIGDLSIVDMKDVLAPFVTAGLITPDDDMENVLRKLTGFGPMPEALARPKQRPALPGSNGSNGGGTPDPPKPGEDPNPEETPEGNAEDANEDPIESAIGAVLKEIEFEKQQHEPIFLSLGGGRRKRIEFYRDDSGRLVERVTEEPEPVPAPEPVTMADLKDVSESVRTLAQSIEHGLKATSGSRARKLERDVNGRITRILEE